MWFEAHIQAVSLTVQHPAGIGKKGCGVRVWHFKMQVSNLGQFLQLCEPSVVLKLFHCVVFFC